VVFSLLLWWTYWSYRTITDWTFLRFVLYLSPVVVFYLLTAIAFPDPRSRRPPGILLQESRWLLRNIRGIRCHGRHYRHDRSADAADGSLEPLSAGNGGLMLIGMRSANARVHTALFVIASLLMLAFITLFQFRLA
jgi:hypothetical protein